MDSSEVRAHLLLIVPLSLSMLRILARVVDGCNAFTNFASGLHRVHILLIIHDACFESWSQWIIQKIKRVAFESHLDACWLTCSHCLIFVLDALSTVAARTRLRRMRWDMECLSRLYPTHNVVIAEVLLLVILSHFLVELLMLYDSIGLLSLDKCLHHHLLAKPGSKKKCYSRLPEELVGRRNLVQYRFRPFLRFT